jgi:2-amino-4-hydroxy-6-hydroxymethyldihydropteridine diphosphokinase
LSTSHLHDSSKEHTVFLSLGGNIGDRKNNLEQALQRLEKVIAIQAVSSVYETEPIGEGGQPLPHDQPLFLNLVCQGRTNLQPIDLLTALKEIEAAMGRLPSFRNAPRPIDIDILLYDNLQVTLPQLIIPHPRMRERAFVLIPLAEIAPFTIEPISGQTIQQLATNVSTQHIDKTSIVLTFRIPSEQGRGHQNSDF